jgi:S-adenosylmethionine/arginine decarboxylase-like enzyme
MKAQMFNFSSWIPETNPSELKTYYTNKLYKSGFIILEISEHYFKPFGYTALFLLSESHFAIHTFPENNESYIELSSCVKEQFYMFIRGK